MSAEARRAVSAQLREARTKLEVTVELASREAGIPARYARMFEEDAFPGVADTAYLTPYLRRYAIRLGLDGDRVVREFLAETEPELGLSGVPRRAAPAPRPIGDGRSQGWAWVAGFATAMVVAVAWFGGFGTLGGGSGVAPAGAVASPNDGEDLDALLDEIADEIAAPRTPTAAPPQATQAAATQAPATQAPATRVATQAAPPSTEVPAAATAVPPTKAVPTASSANVGPTQVATRLPVEPTRVAPTPRPTQVPRAALGGGPYTLRVRAKVRQVWVWVQADGGGKQAASLEKGQSRSFRAKQGFIVTVDDAGGVDLELNGKPLAPLGPKGSVARKVAIP